MRIEKVSSGSRILVRGTKKIFLRVCRWGKVKSCKLSELEMAGPWKILSFSLLNMHSPSIPGTFLCYFLNSQTLIFLDINVLLIGKTFLLYVCIHVAYIYVCPNCCSSEFVDIVRQSHKQSL